ncbi:MAG: hypothetical protein ACOYOV_16635 [Bacteroidales bacterium]
MKNPFGSKTKIIALSFLIIAMMLLLYNALSDFKYWIALAIIFISLVLINYEYFILYKKTKNNGKL